MLPADTPVAVAELEAVACFLVRAAAGVFVGGTALSTEAGTGEGAGAEA